MKHRKITFVPGTLGRFIRKHQIYFDYLEVPPEMICRKRDHPGEKFFILTLRRPSVGRLLKIPFSQGALVRHWPSIERTLETIAADSMMYLSNPTLEEFVSAFGLEDEADAQENFEIIKSLAERTKAFLGDEAFDELIDMEVKGYEMEGDRTWPTRTCG